MQTRQFLRAAALALVVTDAANVFVVALLCETVAASRAVPAGWALCLFFVKMAAVAGKWKRYASKLGREAYVGNWQWVSEHQSDALAAALGDSSLAVAFLFLACAAGNAVPLRVLVTFVCSSFVSAATGTVVHYAHAKTAEQQLQDFFAANRRAAAPERYDSEQNVWQNDGNDDDDRLERLSVVSVHTLSDYEEEGESEGSEQ